MSYVAKFLLEIKVIYCIASLLGGILLTGCSVYQSEGRKSFESKAQKSPNVILTSIDLSECRETTLSQGLEFKNLIEINETQSLGYEHPQLVILTQIASESPTDKLQICNYHVHRNPLSNIEMTQLIEGINHEL